MIVADEAELGGGDGIRTRGPYVANVVLCRTELHPQSRQCYRPITRSQRRRLDASDAQRSSIAFTVGISSRLWSVA